MPNPIHLIVEIINRAEQQPVFVDGIRPLVKGSVSSFINHFKGKIKGETQEKGFDDFKWQGRFHDRIIRTEEEYINIASYIRSNIYNWNADSENRIS